MESRRVLQIGGIVSGSVLAATDPKLGGALKGAVSGEQPAEPAVATG